MVWQIVITVRLLSLEEYTRKEHWTVKTNSHRHAQTHMHIHTYTMKNLARKCDKRDLLFVSTSTRTGYLQAMTNRSPMSTLPLVLWDLQSNQTEKKRNDTKTRIAYVWLKKAITKVILKTYFICNGCFRPRR